MYAARNVALCTKDCLCLFVCPTGATNTETGQIDREKCVEGCRACVDACPSHAIHLVVETYPEPLPKDGAVTEAMLELCEAKSIQEGMALGIAAGSDGKSAALLARGLARSCRILAEDCAREAGYLIPQSRTAGELLDGLAEAEGHEISEKIGRLKSIL